MPSPSSLGECNFTRLSLRRLRLIVLSAFVIGRSIVCGVHPNKKRELLSFLAKFYSQQSTVGQVTFQPTFWIGLGALLGPCVFHVVCGCCECFVNELAPGNRSSLILRSCPH